MGSDCFVTSSCSSFLVSKFLQDSPMFEAVQSAYILCRGKKCDLGGYSCL